MFVHISVFWWEPNGALQRQSTNILWALTGDVDDFYWVPIRHFKQSYFTNTTFTHETCLHKLQNPVELISDNHLGAELKDTEKKDIRAMVYSMQTGKLSLYIKP